MRFHSPDALSPFDEGGLNYYAYCLGNPINLRDPTGHAAIGWSGRLREVYEDDPNNGTAASGGSSLWEWIATGAAVAFSFVAITVATVATYGAAAPLYAAWGKGATAVIAAISAAKVAKAVVSITAAALYVTSAAYGFDAVLNQNPESGKISLITGLAAIALSVGYGAVSGVKSLVTSYKELGSWKAVFQKAIGATKASDATSIGPGSNNGGSVLEGAAVSFSPKTPTSLEPTARTTFFKFFNRGDKFYPYPVRH
ncbi:hypothetical protein D3C79_390260 [compost metagenome]